MNLQGVTGLILAGSTGLGVVTSFALGKRGQKEQARQQLVANDLGQRAQAFDEMKVLVDEIKAENARLRQENHRLEESSDRDLRRQGERCRVALDHVAAAVVTLQGLVVSEIARAASVTALADADTHLRDDHGEHLDPTEGK